MKRTNNLLFCKFSGSHKGGFKEYYFLGYNVMKSAESQSTFRKNISPTFSESKNKRIKITERSHAASRAERQSK
jgi:hypothetical protein